MGLIYHFTQNRGSFLRRLKGGIEVRMKEIGFIPVSDREMEVEGREPGSFHRGSYRLAAIQDMKNAMGLLERAGYVYASIRYGSGNLLESLFS